MHQTQTDSEYKDFYVDKHLFDFSGYKKKIPLYHDKNKKVISKMKDELNGEIIEEYVSLRAKMHLKKMKKAKGVKKNMMKKSISNQDYVDCLFEKRKFINTMQSMQSFII